MRDDDEKKDDSEENHTKQINKNHHHHHRLLSDTFAATSMTSSTTSNGDILAQDSLLKLNDDCLELICLQLNHVEQFVMRNLHLRFETIIDRLWCISLHTVHVEDRNVEVLNDAEFLEFMEILSLHTVDLSLKYLRKHRFELLIDLCFVKVTILKCIDPFEQNRSQAQRYGREALRVLQSCFPNVQELELKGYHVRYCRDIFAIGGGHLKRLELKIL